MRPQAAVAVDLFLAQDWVQLIHELGSQRSLGEGYR